MHTKDEKMEAFGRLLDIMDDLREKCPWDREQTRESLRTNTIEETFELSEAILKDHPEEIKKELGELRAELDRADADASEAEMGDFLFSVINAARLYGINPDNALERTNAKFRRRFDYLEAQTIRRGRSLKDMTLAEMDAIWDEAKRQGM